MLKAREIEFFYPDTTTASIRARELLFEHGKVVCISGENGSGKTTLMLALCGAIPYYVTGRFSGTVILNGNEVNPQRHPNSIATVLQNPITSLIGFTVEEELSSLHPKYTLHSADLVRTLCRGQRVSKLSSGERQRLAIATALGRECEVVILDEPFEYLDDSARQAAITGITSRAESGSCVIVIDRERGRAAMSCNSTIVVDDNVAHTDRPPISEAFPAFALKPHSVDCALSIRAIRFQYERGSRLILDGASLSVNKRESVGIVGSNGSGKSTLLLALGGIFNAEAQDILIYGKRAGRNSLRSSTAVCLPDPDIQLCSETVRKEVVLALELGGVRSDEIHRRIGIAEMILNDFDFDADPFTLSSGRRKILSLVCTFITGRKIVLLDEPTAGLDQRNIARLVVMISDFLDGGGALVMASHDRSFINLTTHRSLAIVNGQLSAGNAKTQLD